jgi:hypothetical protein
MYFFPAGIREIQDVAPFQNMVWFLGDQDFFPSSSLEDRSMFDKTLPNKLIQTWACVVRQSNAAIF